MSNTPRTDKNAFTIYREASSGELTGAIRVVPYRVSEQLETELAEARAEIEALKEAFGFTYCAYCGEKFPVDAPDSTDAVGRHIRTCDKHPVFQLTKKLQDEILENLKHLGTIRWYEEMEIPKKDKQIARLTKALEGVVRVADRATDEFDEAKAAIIQEGKK